MVVAGRELRRIENDKIKLFSSVAEFSKCFKDICFDPFHRAVIETVAFGIFLSHLQRVGRGIDGHDLFGAPGFERKGKSAGVAEAVKRSHASAVHAFEFLSQSAGQSSVIALINVKAGFVAHANVDAVLDVFYDFDFLRRLFALKDLFAFRETLTGSGSGVGTVIHLRAAGVFHQCLTDHRAPILDACGLKLCDDLVVVLINNEPGEEVGLSENQTNCVGAGSQAAASLDRCFDSGFNPGGINDIFFLGRPAAGTER